MTQTVIYANEVQELALKTFGDKKITATMTDDRIVLSGEAERYPNAQTKYKQNIALNNLCGMFKDTGISSYKFAENKKYEKELEERKFNRE